ncbi:paraneoplastic antigen-like protein 8A [Dasypus novemcinctus]|uniref:paraneoplastic antigen-like protein 8A n=1 Tax=Dasypus novemcinctus TaxID=9361 RepID=UPI000C824228|nr:paraneoplastic antigen-like protein 8A [Dasypus novemcinctus]XP_023443829.1 paraneoplastic antigen-like protein 8A [Dasypus novemcinctus]
MSVNMAMNLLEDWCRGMDVDIHRSLLVTGIPQECGQAEIEETLSRVLSPIGPYQLLNKIFMREENAKAALIEVGEGVNLSSIPREFPGRGGVWRVICRDPTQDAEFLKNLNDFLEGEGRTMEDVVRVLQLNQPARPRPQNQNRASENWVEALGALLGMVMQVIFHMDTEMRHREEARALELAEAEAVAASAASASAAAAGRKTKKIKKEPGQAAEVGSALKMESPDHWNDTEGRGDPPKPLVRKARAKTPAKRKRQSRVPKQEPASWKRTRGSFPSSSARLEDREAGESMEISEYVRSNKKPCVKQEQPAARKPAAKCARKLRREPPQDAPSAAEARAPAAEQDGGREGPARAPAAEQDGGREGPARAPAAGQDGGWEGPARALTLEQDGGREGPARAPALEQDGGREGPAWAPALEQDGGREGPTRKKSMGWASARSLAPGRKRKRVSLGPVSYVLAHSEDPKKKPAMPKKGLGSRKNASQPKAPRGPVPTESAASVSQGLKAKPEGSPPASTESRKL